MAEHLMETTVRTALWQQFSAAIDMLENALLSCPETLWQEHLWIDVESADDGTFWEITSHTLGCLDRFLTGCSLEALPALKKRSDGVIPRDELHPYLVQLRQQCQTTFAALSDEQAHQQYTFPWPGGATVSYFELLLYTLRHGPRTCGSTEPLSRTARHPGRGAQLGSACEGGSRPLSGFAPCECASLASIL